MAPDAGPVITKDYQAATSIPLVQIAVYQTGIGYNEPLITADGAPVTPDGPGRWGQLYAAGRY